MRSCTLVYPYFDNPRMLSLQVDQWNRYPQAILDIIKIILVDDHSEQDAEGIFQNCQAPKAPLRFKSPGLWTMHEARNLGAFFCMTHWTSEWLFMSDIDLVATGDFLESLLSRELCTANHYTFERVLAPAMTFCPPHRNSYLVTPAAFAAVNGYDVDYTVCYGGIRRRRGVCGKTKPGGASRSYCKDLTLVGYNESIDDSFTRKWDREEWHLKYLSALAKKVEARQMDSLRPIRRLWEQIA